ncbi:transcription factor TFIIIB component B'' homolog [Excalfactoria chinensis]|uniref:transcription factor TFIIIB component B'' homolog n=1 Tax=Excalfactoria chinensis TaxID=46218 RepID=UPI003B3ADDCC
MKTAHRKKPVKEQRSSKTSSLVTLRASQEDEEEADDFEPVDEDECFAEEEVNKAPVFVPEATEHENPEADKDISIMKQMLRIVSSNT